MKSTDEQAQQLNRSRVNDNYSDHSGQVPGKVHHLFLGTSTKFEPYKRRYQPQD
jgi:hypothetical protein